MTALFILAMATVPLSACGDSKAKKNAGSDDTDSRIKSELRELTRTITEGDASGFAAMCDYPIERPYPLKAIENAEEMTRYFPILADDSLRNIMRNAGPDDWEAYGWRGWSLSECQPLWYDGGVEIINYESGKEREMRGQLAREEIRTLAPEYREGWTPVTTLIETDGKRIFRIDQSGDVYRIMGFPDPTYAHGVPELLLNGIMESEGSAALRYYIFDDNAGSTAEYTPDGELPLRIWLTRPQAGNDTVVVTAGYWRDYVK